MSRLPDCCFPSKHAALAERMYCAYNRGGDPDTAGLNYAGKPCPVWADLPGNVKAKWVVASGEAYWASHSAIKGRDTGAVVMVLNYGYNAVAVIRAVKSLTGMGLKEAKGFVESLPRDLTPHVNLDSEENIRLVLTLLREAGAAVEVS